MLYCDTFTNTGVILAKISAKHQIRLPKNGAITTVNSAVITSERLPMAPYTSPISSARTVPKAWLPQPMATPCATGSVT